MREGLHMASRKLSGAELAKQLSGLALSVGVAPGEPNELPNHADGALTSAPLEPGAPRELPTVSREETKVPSPVESAAHARESVAGAPREPLFAGSEEAQAPSPFGPDTPPELPALDREEIQAPSSGASGARRDVAKAPQHPPQTARRKPESPTKSRGGRPAKAGIDGMPVNVRLSQADHLALARLAGKLMVPGRPMPTVQDVVRGIIRGALKEPELATRFCRQQDS